MKKLKQIWTVLTHKYVIIITAKSEAGEASARKVLTIIGAEEKRPNPKTLTLK